MKRINVAFSRVYENRPTLLMLDSLAHEKFILISYFFLNYESIFLIDRFMKVLESTDNSILEFEIGYGAGCLGINHQRVFFQTYGLDPGSLTIEVSYENFKEFVLSWREFILLEKQYTEVELNVLNVYSYVYMKFEPQEYEKYNLFWGHYQRKSELTGNDLFKIKALAYFVADHSGTIVQTLDSIQKGEKGILVHCFLGYDVGVLIISDLELTFQAFENQYGFESSRLTIPEFQQIIHEWQAFINA